MSFYDSKSIETGTFSCKILRMGSVDIYCLDRIVFHFNLIGPDSKDGSVFALFNLSFYFQYYSLHTNTYQNVKKMSS